MSASISILIITFNRPDDLLELLESIRRQEKISLVSEILILNNASTVSYDKVETFIQQNPQLRIAYSISKENLGVSRGRNELMTRAKAELLLVLDDDILFSAPADLEKIAMVFDKQIFQENNTGVITFKVVYHETGEQQITAFPHKRYAEMKDKAPFLTYYFSGCSHLMKKEVLSKTGLYPKDFFYGMEEYDLSYRIIGAGYSLGYDDDVTFIHKESPKGRQPQYQKLASQWINKSKTARRYLPSVYYVTTMMGWSFEYLRKAKGHWGTYFNSWKKALAVYGSERRKPLTREALNYLKKSKSEALVLSR